MTDRRRKRDQRRLPHLGTLLIALLCGGTLVFLGLGLAGRIRWDDRAATSAASRDPLDPEARARMVAMLAAVLEPQASWQSREVTVPLVWRGEIPAAESLVQWNARITRICEELGLEILAGTEEIIERRGRWPLQRLTLTAGFGGETVATVIVELARQPSLPPTF